MSQNPNPTPTLSVIVPCYNEQFNLPELAKRVFAALEQAKIEGDLILVDDGSTDSTADVIRDLESQYPSKVIGCFHDSNQGITGAWKTGAIKSKAEYVCIIDADLQYQPEDVPRLYHTLEQEQVDVVQGWRSTVGRERGSRFWLSRSLNYLLNKNFGMSLQDNKSGFVCCAREVMLDLLTYEKRYYYWQSFIMVAAHAKGYTYREVETLFENRKQGESFLQNRAYRTAALVMLDLHQAGKEYRHPLPQQNLDEKYAGMVKRPPTSPPSQATHALRWAVFMKSFNQTHWMITNRVEAAYENLHRTQWLEKSQLKQLQDDKLRRLVRHAYHHVPFWHQRMQSLGLKPNDITTVEDLQKLPFLTKDQIRQTGHFDLLATNLKREHILRIRTSGSTGQPLVCFADRRQLEFRWAATLRAQEWTGYKFGDPTVRLWHQTIGLSPSQTVKEYSDAFLSNRSFVPLFEMSEKRLEQMIEKIRNANPVLIDGYAEAFDFLAQYLNAHPNLAVRPKAIMSSAQTLPARSRQLIESAFGCRVFDKYGSREFSGIAYECNAHNGHHIVSEGYIVEILVDGRPAKPGEIGEVVITDLNNYAMPFLRYRIGDLAEAMEQEPCACGRESPKIGAIQGRVQSIIQGSDGRYVPGTFFAHCLKEFDYALKQFQIVQNEKDAIVLRIVKGGRYSDSVLDEIRDIIKAHLGQDLRIDVEFVEQIEMVVTGKRLASVSHLAIDFQKNAPVHVNNG
jgi:phenylacetate-CoA ligase